MWRREGFTVPKEQSNHWRLWTNEDSCGRLRPQHRNHGWAYDFVAARTHEGRPLRLLTIVDEYTRECLAIEVARALRADAGLHRLAELYGRPEYIRSDNGPSVPQKPFGSGSISWVSEQCVSNRVARGRMAIVFMANFGMHS